MFCNKCGKTLNPEAKDCSSCGQPVGDSRFEGSGYTSSQVRFVPDKAEREGYAPYTKTTYSSMSDEDGDVYSRTSYRPALSEEEGRRTTGFADDQGEPESPEAQSEPEAADGAQPEAHEAPEPEGEPARDERDALGIEIRPLEPIRKTGISPEVQRYIQQMNQRKGRGQPRSDDVPDGDAQGAGDAQDSQEYAALSRGGLGKWAIRIGGAVAVLVLLIVGVLFIVDRTANRADIPGVTYTLYTEGIAMVKQRATNEYRTEIIKLWRADQTGKAAAQQQEGEAQQIAKLMPEKPLENDQAFVDTLLSIQNSINDATAIDAIAALAAGNTALGSLSQESEKNWQLISGKITELEAATSLQQLTEVQKGVDLATIATPEPEPSPTPSPYRTLKKGMKNNRQVKNLQDRLFRLGWFNGVRDGDFGPATQTAVKKFQKGIGLSEAEQDGIATPELQELLFAEDAPRGDGKPAATPAANDPIDDIADTAPEGDEAPAA